MGVVYRTSIRPVVTGQLNSEVECCSPVSRRRIWMMLKNAVGVILKLTGRVAEFFMINRRYVH